MALDLTALTDYIDEQQFNLATASLVGGRTAGFLTPQLGVKGETKINKMDVDVTMQDGSGCTFDASGDNDITFTQETIDAKQVKINMEFCPKDLNAYYWRTQMPAGTHQESLPFEEQFANYLVAKVQDSLETVIWNGDATSGSGNNAMFDGILIDAANFTDCNGTGGSFGSAITGAIDINNVVEAVERIYVEAPSAAVAQNDFRCYLGVDKFRALSAAIMNGNGGASILAGAALQGSMDRADVDPLRIIMPGTNMEIVGVGGLNTADKVVGFSSSNVFLGMDLAEDSTNIESWYSQDDRKFKVAMEWTMGVGIAYKSEVAKVIV
jgi:hypothetical protein